MFKNNLLSLVLFIIWTLNSSAQNSFGSLGIKEYKNVHALIVGISEYAEIKDLTYADNDAELFYEILKLTYPNSIGNFKTLTNENATAFSIQMAIQEVTMKIKEGDLFIIYFSGHGDVGEWIGEDKGYLLGHDASESRVYEVGGGIALTWINGVTDAISSNKKADVWLLTDACHSGKVINEQGAETTLATLAGGFRNTTKFISCQAHEKSYEYETIKHGAFTYYLAKCFSGSGNSDANSSTLTIKEIDDYMGESVRQYTSQKQTPTTTSSDKYMIFFKINPEIAQLINSNPENDDVASNDKGIEIDKGVGENQKSQQLIDFENALIKGDLYGKNSSAYEQYLSVKGKVTDDESKLMKSLLIEALVKRGQQNTNLFLSGRPTLDPTETMASTASDFKLAGDLLGKDHFLYNDLELKRRFFSAMIAVEESNSSQYKNSEAELLALQKIQPNAAHVNQGLAFLYVKMADQAKAEKQLTQAQSKINTWTKPTNTIAHINIVNGNLEKAKKIVDERCSSGKDMNNVQILKAQLYTANMELQVAEEALTQIKYSNTKDELEYYLLQGKVNELKGRISIAESFYNKALKLDSKNAEAELSLGKLYKNDGDTVNALLHLEKALQLKPNELTIQHLIAELNGSEVKTKNFNYYSREEVLSVVDYRLSKNDAEGAISFLNEALKVSKYDPELDYALAKAHYANRNNDAAIISLKNALNKSPYHFESIKSLTFILILQKKFTEADAVIKKYNDNFKYSSKWRVFAYEAYQKMQKTENLIFILEEAIKLDSTDTEAYKALYRIHLDEGNYKSAQQQYQHLKSLGGRMKDSTNFILELVNAVEKRIDEGKADNKALQGLDLILQYDKFFLGRMLSEARKNYQALNYKVADIHLEHYKKYLFALQGEAKYEYFRIKAYLLLEVRMYTEALELFKQVTTYSKRECYIGVAMAKYELGHDEQGWMTYFRQAKDLNDLNSVAIERYKKMSANSGYYTPGGR